jgi:hypothetical protein
MEEVKFARFTTGPKYNPRNRGWQSICKPA